MAAVLVLVAGMSACSNSVDTEPVGNGQCEQTHEQRLLGLTYSTQRSRVACDR